MDMRPGDISAKNVIEPWPQLVTCMTFAMMSSEFEIVVVVMLVR
jgi:hypothetical protein